MTGLHPAVDLEEAWTAKLKTARKTQATAAEIPQTAPGKEEGKKEG